MGIIARVRMVRIACARIGENCGVRNGEIRGVRMVRFTCVQMVRFTCVRRAQRAKDQGRVIEGGVGSREVMRALPEAREGLKEATSYQLSQCTNVLI
jgi:hypothetical protein